MELNELTGRLENLYNILNENVLSKITVNGIEYDTKKINECIQLVNGIIEKRV